MYVDIYIYIVYVCVCVCVCEHVWMCVYLPAAYRYLQVQRFS